MSLQEKFQITTPPPNDESKDHEWATQASARDTRGVQGLHYNNQTTTHNVAIKTNYMPPGMHVNNQDRARINPMPLVMSGQSDVSADTNPESFERGFTRRDMKGADDQYTGEHMDHFYGEAVDELGNVGFVERNNYLDRE